MLSPQKTRVFLLPSWYPTPTDSVAGSFVRDQAAALAASDQLSVAVGTWGHGDVEMSLRRPGQSFHRALRHFARRREADWLDHGAQHFRTERLTWPARLPRWGIGPIMSASRKNLLRARASLGGIDLIHAHVSYPAGYIAAVLGAEFDIPYVITEHMSPFPFESLMRGGRPIPELDVALNRSSTNIAVSSSLAKTMSEYGYTTDFVVPNVIDGTAFRPAPASHRQFTYLTVASMTSRKGIRDLLEAISIWDPSPASVQFRIVGSGPESNVFKAIARELGLSDRVTWLGPLQRREVRAEFEACHAFVLPSHAETFGVVLAEALACGKPVVATRCGGPEDIVNSGNGLLTESKDPPALATSLARLMKTYSNYDFAAIRADCLARFGTEHVVETITGIYAKVLRTRS